MGYIKGKVFFFQFALDGSTYFDIGVVCVGLGGRGREGRKEM